MNFKKLGKEIFNLGLDIATSIITKEDFLTIKHSVIITRVGNGEFEIECNGKSEVIRLIIEDQNHLGQFFESMKFRKKINIMISGWETHKRGTREILFQKVVEVSPAA